MGTAALRFLGAALAATAFAACNDAAAPPPPPSSADDLTGTVWVQSGWDEQAEAIVCSRADELAGEVIGYAFAGEGALVYRSFGWCATPPLTFFNQDGTWQQPDGTHLRLDYPGAIPTGTIHYEIVEHTAETLKLRRYEPTGDAPQAGDPWQGRWEGTYTLVRDRGSPKEMKETGDVAFVVTGDRYRVIPARPLLPPDAAGSLAIATDVTLVDELFHTADYDWTLNIGGAFTYALGDDTLVLRQDDAADGRLRTFILRRVSSP